MKAIGKPYEGELHVRFDVAGNGNQAMVKLVRHSQRKQRATDRPYLTLWRHSLTLLIITSHTPERLEEEVKPLVEQFLKERDLKLSPEKTQITPIEDGFDFLGQHIRKYKGKLLTKPSPKNVKTFLGKIRDLVKTHQQAQAGNLIAQLNPVIRGWANYHRHAASKETFTKVDRAIFNVLWQWAKRRHPQKPFGWIKKKYFRTIKQRSWIFHGEITATNGKTQEIRLFHAADVPIQRHIKIKGEANPYDPQWEIYFEERLGIQMAHNLKGKRKLLYLWKEQNGLCPICHQKITKLTGWHNHHIVWRTNGGGDNAENRVLLHPNCHRQVHNQSWTVVKPRPARGV